jgi:hypothetical protein
VHAKRRDEHRDEHRDEEAHDRDRAHLPVVGRGREEAERPREPVAHAHSPLKISLAFQFAVDLLPHARDCDHGGNVPADSK